MGFSVGDIELASMLSSFHFFQTPSLKLFACCQQETTSEWCSCRTQEQAIIICLRIWNCDVGNIWYLGECRVEPCKQHGVRGQFRFRALATWPSTATMERSARYLCASFTKASVKVAGLGILALAWAWDSSLGLGF